MTLFGDRVRKNRKSLLFAGCLIGLVVIGIVLWPDREPRYEGRSLYEWLLLYAKSANREAAPGMGQQATAAVRSIGTNALPCLLRWLRYQPSPARDSIWALLEKLPAPISQSSFVASLRDDAAIRFQLAASGFVILRAQAEPAIPELTRLVNDTNNPYASQQASYCLTFIGEDALPPLLIALADSTFPYRSQVAGSLGSILRQTAGTNLAPALFLLGQCATNKDDNLASAALDALGRIALRPEISLPPILNALQCANPRVKVAAARAVARFGVEGRPAIPALLRACDDPDVFVRHAATNSLRAITPESPYD